MQIVPPNFVASRKKPHEVVNAPNPAKPQRIKLLRDTVVWAGGGDRLLGRAGDVIEVDRATAEGWEATCLLCGNSDAGLKAPLSTPLFSAPSAPPPMAPPVEKPAQYSLEQFARTMLAIFKEGLQQPRPTKG